MKIIKRPRYLEKIKPHIGKNIIKVLVGARRTGKTYLLFQIIEEIKKIDSQANIIYINKEQYEFRFIDNDENLYSYVVSKSKTNKKNYVFIDEVQEIKYFEKALRALLVDDFDIYCTGSNAHMLSSDIATYLSGRYIEIPVYSLSYKEFLKFHNLKNTKNSLTKYIKYGGLPYLINLELNDEIVYDYLSNIYNTIILKDVVTRYNIRDIDFLQRLIEYTSDNLGSYISSKKITDYLKSQKVSLSVNTVMNYLQYLQNAFFIDKVRRYDITGKRIFEINEKYYFRDLGLKHSVVPYKPNDIAKILENLIYNQLIFNGYTVYTGKLYDLEIDFVAIRGNEKIYIQSTYLLSDDKTVEREFGNLLKIKDNYPKLVISADDFTISNYEGVEHLNILNFLNK
ncbi:MAG: ATP-binding protein [Bacteroidales bacterium]|nr:ATP-binding protein [Bacteroidales bacterium]